MKRIISLFLLLLLLIFGAQPTLAMHYCGGSLQSVKILNGQKDGGCCEANHHQNSSDQTQESLSSNGCCFSQAVQLSVDNFQIREQQTLLNKAWDTPLSAWFVSPILSNNLHFSFSERLRPDYPPKGFEYANVDILTYISILVI